MCRTTGSLSATAMPTFAARRDRRPAGAAALTDIGRMFPDTDQANRQRDSAEMLAVAAAKVADAGYQIVNLDCIVHAERPKLADYHDAIRHRIAGILQLSPHQIGVKAKTGEGVGPVGQGELIEARCVALLGTNDVRLCSINRQPEIRNPKSNPHERLHSPNARPSQILRRPPHAPRLQHAVEAQRTVRDRASRGRWASTCAGRPCTTRHTSATWSGR